MKKRNLVICSILAGSILTIGTAGLVHACGGPGGHYYGDHRGDKMRHVMKKLDLTTEQREAIRNIKDEQREQMSTKRDEMMDIRKALREQVRADSYDASKVRELADTKAKLMADMTVKRIETMNRIRKELTPEQVAKLDSFKERGFRRGDF